MTGAKAFYGAVFGWQTMTVGGGAEMWTLPGYGDHLEERTPGLREQMAGMGGPAGFEDVVASINPIADDQPDIPAHWSVTFATDDADATAAKAAELGGKLIAEPFDAPWVRMTVIADPQGATLDRKPVRDREPAIVLPVPSTPPRHDHGGAPNPRGPSPREGSDPRRGQTPIKSAGSVPT